MRRETIINRLDATGIRREEETVTPVAGAVVSLPYFIVRTSETDTSDDAGRVSVTTTAWTVTLFTTNKDFALECKIRKALCGVGTVNIERFPDEEPYSVDFRFTTKGALL